MPVTVADTDERLAKVLAELRKMTAVKAVYLFGSHATGRATPLSDTDLCVVTRPKIRRAGKTDIASLSGGTIDVSLWTSGPWSAASRRRPKSRMNEKTVAARNDMEKYLAGPDRPGIAPAPGLNGPRDAERIRRTGPGPGPIRDIYKVAGI